MLSNRVMVITTSQETGRASLVQTRYESCDSSRDSSHDVSHDHTVTIRDVYHC